MNEKEVAEIRRRFNPQKTNISRIQGCYVNEEGKILTEFSQPLVTLSEEETQAVLTLLKKALSGTLDKNLINLEFPNAEIIGGQKHKNLLSGFGTQRHRGSAQPFRKHSKQYRPS